MQETKTIKEPLFHIIKRDNLSKKKSLLIYAVSILVAFVIASIFCAVSSSDGGSPLDMFVALFDGVFGTERRIWLFLRDTAILLGVSLAIIPAFKMKFWNLGANGQVLVGCLASYACLFYTQNTNISSVIVILLMIVSSILAGMIWAVIPAIFKAFFKTNESLFTLMMNYIAEGLVLTLITIWAPSGSGTLTPISKNTLPKIVNDQLLSIIVVAIVTVFITIYLKKSKHGYELAVVGESENTAKYVGMNVKKVIIRTLLLSGAICGLMGLLLTGSINHSVNSTMHGGLGFTAIMTSWLAKFNPLVLIGTCALITFVSRGMGEVRKAFGFYNDALANVVLGLIYFFIIGCEFFINYKVIFRKKKNTTNEKQENKANTIKEDK
ncbi:MAG: ABC transporter permease [Clostridia bacterium]|nr:ABC transporter permease [Clostridia bacterium]